MHPLRILFTRLTVLSPVLLALPAQAALQLGSPFADHMILQRERPAPIWGTAAPGDRILVAFAGQVKSVRADATGGWQVNLDPLQASEAPRSLVVTSPGAQETIRIEDVLVGEVWLCGGQSNMERPLGPRWGLKPVVGADAAAAAANYPLIRQLYVDQQTAPSPRGTTAMHWTVCSPRTALDFTAVGFFFARDLHQRLGVPVGIIHSSWGGTPAQSWTSAAGLDAFPDFQPQVQTLADAVAHPEKARAALQARFDEWYFKHDPGTSSPVSWADPALETNDWSAIELPASWKSGFDGVVWLRRRLDLPASWRGEDIELRLSAIDDADTTWVNGAEMGRTDGWDTPRIYRVPGSLLKKEGNLIAIRALDAGNNGGLWNDNLPLEARALDGSFSPVSLRGPWLIRYSTELRQMGQPPQEPNKGPGTPTVLYNGMIAPLVPYALRGFAFYQGEANVWNSRQYRSLLPALIADWRKHWGDDTLPFLFVQIAPYKDMWPEIREAQLLAWQNTPNTAMAVTIDCGDAEDIHPADKAPVGARLALAARALAYGEAIEYSGPVFSGLDVQGGRAVLTFKHLGGGLVAKDGPLTGFTIAGANGEFHPAEARIAGDTVEVSSPDVPQPRRVRYGWANVASGNLFNRAGLPASPFRSDVD